jgi:hypothetical protein
MNVLAYESVANSSSPDCRIDVPPKRCLLQQKVFACIVGQAR